MKFTEYEIYLLKLAVSYLKSNIPDVEEAMDVLIAETDIDKLEEKLYNESEVLNESN